MTIEGGLLLMILGALSLLWSVTKQAVERGRWVETFVETRIDPAMTSAFPPPPIAFDLERLVSEADARLQSSELTRQRRRWVRRGGRTARGR